MTTSYKNNKAFTNLLFVVYAAEKLSSNKYLSGVFTLLFQLSNHSFFHLMRTMLLLAVLLSGTLSTQAQVVFPQSHFGVWQGTLYISAPGARQPQKTPMKLTIDSLRGRSNRYAFYIQYGDQPPRNYELVIVDPVRGLCQIDEKDGIVLSATQLGNRLISQFSLGANFITTTYTFGSKTVAFDLVFTGTKPTRTGPANQPVLVHTATNYQHAELTKVKE